MTFSMRYPVRRRVPTTRGRSGGGQGSRPTPSDRSSSRRSGSRTAVGIAGRAGPGDRGQGLARPALEVVEHRRFPVGAIVLP